MTDTTPQAAGTSWNLLFVCTGNTCRSPMAESIARGMLAERGWTHVDVRSAGIAASHGEAASVHAVDVAREQGYDLSRHESQPLTPALVAWADLVLAMGHSHIHAITQLGGGEKVSLVTEWVRGTGAGAAVADPFGGDRNDYDRAFRQLTVAVSAVLDRLEPILAP